MAIVYYKAISGKVSRDAENPLLESNDHIFDKGAPLEMRSNAIQKIKDFFELLVINKSDEYDKIPTKEELVSEGYKSKEVHFFEIRFINGDEENTIYSTLKHNIDTEVELFDGLLKETLWYKTNGYDIPIFEFKKPFNGFMLQADFDFICARMKTLKKKDENEK